MACLYLVKLVVILSLWISHHRQVGGLPLNVTSYANVELFNESTSIHQKMWHYPTNITRGQCTLEATTKGMHQKIINSLQDSKLIEYFITINGYNEDPLKFKEGSLYYKPFHWTRVASGHGQTILSLAFNYGVLSLKTLSFGITKFDVSLQDMPAGCFGRLDEDTKILVIMDIVMKDFGENQDIQVTEGGTSVCHQYIDSNDGVAQFTDRCCYINLESSKIECIVNMPNKWLKILEIFLGILTVTSFFFAPIIMPDWIYSFAMNKVDYYVRLKEPLHKTIAVVRRKCNSVTDIYHNKSKIIDLREDSDIRGRPELKECRRLVSQLPSDMIIPVKISQFDIKVNYKKLLVENNVPVGILDSLFHAIFMCRISELQAFNGCCGAHVVGDRECLKRQSACFRIIQMVLSTFRKRVCCCTTYSQESKCRRRCRARCFCFPRVKPGDAVSCMKQYRWISVCNIFGKIMLVLLLLLPYYLRLIAYFQYEHPEIQDRRSAATALGLTMNINHRMMQYLSPTHPLYIIMYIIYMISGIAIAIFTGIDKKTKYQDVITAAFVDMNNLSMLKAFEMLIINLLWPFKKYGIYGLFIGIILWPLLLPISTLICSIYCLPLVFVTCRIIWYIFLQKPEIEEEETPLSQKFLADNFIATLRSSKPMPVERERYCYCNFYCKFLLNLCLATACICSIFCVMIFLTEIISFIAEIVCFTLMGLIVNASTVLKYGTLFLLVVIYCYDSYSTVNKTYLKLNKTIFKCIKDRLGADIKAYTELPSELQGCRGFKAQEADEQPDYEKPDDLVNMPFHWGINDLIMFVDKEDTPRIPKTLFDKVCKIEAAGAPGPVYRSLLKATQKFIVLLLFLGLVFIIVMSFGDSYQMSSTNQMLATMAGGFMPFMFKNIFRPARPDVETDLLSFKSKLDEIIEGYYEIWPMTDFIFEIEDEIKEEEDDGAKKDEDGPPKGKGGDKDKDKKKKKNEAWLKSVSRITNVDLDQMKQELEDRDFEPAEGCNVDILIHASEADREWEFSDDMSDYIQGDVRSEPDNMNGAICMTASEASSLNSYAFSA